MNDEAMKELEARAEAVAAPISEEMPGGEDASFDEDCEQVDLLANEILTGERVDEADALVEKAEALLAQRSKHLKVAVQWLYGLLVRDRYQGLLLGLKGLKRLLEDRWEVLWPRKALSRRRQIEFVNLTLAERAGYMKPAADEVAPVRACWEEIGAIHSVLAARFEAEGQSMPSLGNLREILANHLVDLTGEAPQASTEEPGAVPEQEAGEPAGAGAPAEEDAFAAYRAKLLAPISEEEPTGEDPRYTTEVNHPFETAQNLFEARDNWPGLLDACEHTLQNWAKDIPVAVYLTVGLSRTRGYQGFLLGLQVLEGLLTQYGDRCHPRRARSWAMAMQSLNERASEALRLVPGDEPVPRALLTQCAEALQRIPERVTELMGDKVRLLSFGELNEMIHDLLSQAPPEERQEPDAGKPTGAPSAERAGAPSVPAAAPELALTAEAFSMDEVQDRLIQFADQLRQVQPALALSYRLKRIALWGHLTEAPRADGGKTLVPMDSRHLRNYEGIMAAASSEAPDWLDIVNRCEDMLTERVVFLLDLHRVCYEALLNLGDDYRAAAEAVAAETGSFVKLMPGIEQLFFSDGTTPFADSPTQDWLSGDVAKLLGSGAGGGGGEVSPEALQPLEEAFAEKDITKALDAFYAWYRTLPVGPVKVHGALAAARNLVARQQVYLARCLLAAISEELQTTHAEVWIPELCVRVWSQLQMCNQNLQGQLREQRNESQAAALEVANQQLLARISSMDWKRTGLVAK